MAVVLVAAFIQNICDARCIILSLEQSHLTEYIHFELCAGLEKIRVKKINNSVLIFLIFRSSHFKMFMFHFFLQQMSNSANSVPILGYFQHSVLISPCLLLLKF